MSRTRDAARAALLSAAFLATAGAVRADPLPRAPAISGQVVQTRTGEEFEPVENPVLRNVEVRQDVKAGDVIRTNAYGQIALLFADRTQVRIARNSTLVVKDVRADGGVTLNLAAGQIFARATRGGSGVSVETAAATAAIRGTDWTMTVAGARTTLSVIEGVVDLANAQGSVTVREGESAAATLGQAPTKVVIAGGTVAEQVLYNLSLRNAFELFPNSPLSLDAGRTLAEGARLDGVPDARRTSGERVLAAEIAYERDGRAAAGTAIARARSGGGLTAEEDARLDLLEGQIAAYERRYGEALRLFERAEPRLSGEQRVKARYLAYYARSLGDPSRAAEPPRADPSSLNSVVGEAVTTAFLQSPRESLAILLAGEPRFGRNAEYQASIADVAFLVNERAIGEAALAKAIEIDPDSPTVLGTRANYRARFQGDRDGALADARRVVRLTPGNSGAWNALAELESDRGAAREAEIAYRRAIELDPRDPVGHANYAIFLLGQNRVPEARAEIDRALAVDPDFEIGYLAKGTQQLASGDRDGATESLLRATTANPTYGDGLLVLGASYAARGEFEAASQSFELADRFDPLSPAPPQYRAALAIDQYEADAAIRFAEEAVARTRARGGDYEPIENSRDFGTVLGAAYRFLSLDAWGRYYGDRVFDPFASTSYFDQSLSGSVSPFAFGPSDRIIGPDPVPDQPSGFASALQGLLLDPLALADSSFRPTFIRTPFRELEIGGGASFTGGDVGGSGTATYQSLGLDPLPYSLNISASTDAVNPSFADQSERNASGSVGFGVQVAPYDRVIGLFAASRSEGGLAIDGLPLTSADRQDAESFNGVLGWSHTFGYRNVLNAAVLGAYADRSAFDDRALFLPGSIPAGLGLPPFDLEYDIDARSRSRRVQGGVSHLLGIGEDVVLRYGGEIGYARDTSEGVGDLTLDNEFLALRTRACFTDVLLAILAAPDFDPLRGLLAHPAGPARCPTDRDDETGAGRIYADIRADLAPGLQVEGALFAERGLGGALADDDGRDDTRLSPRVGAAFAPFEGQYLRAAFLRTEPTAEINTLAPVDVLGLRPDAVPGGAGRVDTTILRWDSQWTSRFFTAAEYQHQSIDSLEFAVPATLDALLVPDAELDRVTVTGNLWIGGGFGAFASYAHTWSSGGLAGAEDRLPFLPEDLARVGLTYVGPQRIRLTLAETYLGSRTSNLSDVTLDDAFTTDVTASFETEDRHLALDVGVFNLFGEAIEIAPEIPSARRSVRATLKARF